MKQSLSQAFRDARYASARLEVTARPDGAVLLHNPTPVETPFRTMSDSLRHWAEAAPERTWLAERSGEGWRTLSFREADQAVAALAGGLREAGLIGARPLLILARNCIDHALIAYAAMSQGMPTAPVSAQYGLPGANLKRLAHAVGVLRPAAIFTEDALLFGEALAADFLSGLTVIALRNPRRGDLSFDELLRTTPARASALPDDHAKYLLTSGSTGLPKAAICLHRNIVVNAAQLNAVFDDPEPPITLNSAPWSHALGANSILHMTAHRGGSLYIDAGQPVPGRFDETLRNLASIAPTFYYAVPAGWMLLAAALENNPSLARRFFSRVRLLQYGGANLSQEFCDRIEAMAVRTVGEKISFTSGYGSTETGPTIANVHWRNDRTGLLGLPIPGSTIKLAPHQGKFEVRVRGPQVTCGYLNEPERSAMAFDDEGFFCMGDAARFVDEQDPSKGLAFDGRLSENFKLATGAFVSVGDVRIAALGAVGEAVTDAVVCGEGRDRIGLLLYPHPDIPRDRIDAAVRSGLEKLNESSSSGASVRIGRALVLSGPPDAHAGEITDKGYIAQALARSLRATELEKLFAEPAPPGVIVLG